MWFSYSGSKGMLFRRYTACFSVLFFLVYGHWAAAEPFSNSRNETADFIAEARVVVGIKDPNLAELVRAIFTLSSLVARLPFNETNWGSSSPNFVIIAHDASIFKNKISENTDVEMELNGRLDMLNLVGDKCNSYIDNDIEAAVVVIDTELMNYGATIDCISMSVERFFNQRINVNVDFNQVKITLN